MVKQIRGKNISNFGNFGNENILQYLTWWGFCFTQLKLNAKRNLLENVSTWIDTAEKLTTIHNEVTSTTSCLHCNQYCENFKLYLGC